ncbi:MULTISPECIES: gas vesicle protein GvpR [Fictibacillus]|uniref:Gas vesicle protein GvpR n=1 Tax=Fictibacillus terranigra TaxID=3058424 RepID=A0ABT8E4Y7_9BACL|nr:gas vesicle protein GvpR [Fictibacillus sp. CENA-BCM004]MDN4072965.1 gas vesicle protein GvpR [Fictibacillus sp. CENA-BCM004]
MEITKVMQAVTRFFKENVAPPHKITSVEATDDEGAKVIMEVFEEKEYMKKYAKDEMVGVYQVILNKNNEILSFTRLSVRYRSAIGQEA